MKILAVVIALGACGKSSSSGGGTPEAPPPAPAFAMVQRGVSVTTLPKLERPPYVVWIDAGGTLAYAESPKVWDGKLPQARTQAANLDVLVAALEPAPEPEPAKMDLDPAKIGDQASDRSQGMIKFAKTNDDPALARQQALQAAGIWDKDRGFERPVASIGSRAAWPHAPLVMAAPGAPAVTIAKLVMKLGGALGVVLEKSDQPGALTYLFRAAKVPSIYDDSRSKWIELHLGDKGVEVLSLPSNGRTLVPWVKGRVDGLGLTAVLKGAGTRELQLDVLVNAGVTYQQLVDTLVTIDAYSVTTVAIGEPPGPPDERLKQVQDLRDKRANNMSPTAVVVFGQPNSQGDLDKAIIRRVIRTHGQELLACYDAELAKTAGISGTVNTQFFITPNGDVANAAGSGISPEVSTCVAAAIKTFVFPKPKGGGGGVLVNYPFTFRPRGT